MARVEFEIETSAAPERVIAALTDFSDRRPALWPGLDPSYFEVYGVSGSSADVREGSKEPVDVWAHETYDWSTPGAVKWTVQESNLFRAGSSISTEIRPADGGSLIHFVWDRVGANEVGEQVVSMVTQARGSFLADYYRQALDRLA